MNVTDQGRSYDLEMKRMTDQSQYMVALFQQSSFILTQVFACNTTGNVFNHNILVMQTCNLRRLSGNDEKDWWVSNY
jgi:hypothetical protein